jgi:predicted flap endonuclease-1-like 5' DNA nuclease
MNGLTLLLLIALAIGLFIAYRIGVMRGRRQGLATAPLRPAAGLSPPPVPLAPESSAPMAPAPAPMTLVQDDGHSAERARLIRSLESENAGLRRHARGAAAVTGQLQALAEDRRRLLADLAAARGETARYRAIVIDLENNAPPRLLDGPTMPDDLKLIVGVGPVLERMLHQMGVSTYKQIARWSERDIDEFDARLPEFSGRIRRDTWVVQARALHQSKFGETLPVRDRG